MAVKHLPSPDFYGSQGKLENKGEKGRKKKQTRGGGGNISVANEYPDTLVEEEVYARNREQKRNNDELSSACLCALGDKYKGQKKKLKLSNLYSTGSLDCSAMYSLRILYRYGFSFQKKTRDAGKNSLYKATSHISPIMILDLYIGLPQQYSDKALAELKCCKNEWVHTRHTQH
ncbi:hypothetical protein ACJX0J_038666, partial [Zea mays]